ncbi:MAG: FAD-dependent oxidoreductase [Deltaproteobacteria bacterium]|nr:FAD-dependent oxidoreductase [Deltaproteobacteria bacterium]
MTRLPPDRSEVVFDDFKPAFTPNQAVVEANRCLYCVDAPCIRACPTSIDIPDFIRKIATGNLRGSANTIFASNVLGTSCARVCPVEVLCVGDCVYNEMGVPPIQIGKLQRYATDAAVMRGQTFGEAGPDTGRSVGLIGGGPASLAAAHRLRRFGHRVTIYDSRPLLGGLNVTGIAPYKMKSDAVEHETDWVLAIGGIEVLRGVSVPRDRTWDQLLTAHDALFLGFGLGPDSVLELPGGGLGGIEGAVSWIERMKLGRVDLSAVRSAVVLGGGNTALDAVRELAGLGVPEVTMVYRGNEAQMSGYAHEWKAAKNEGVRASWGSVPQAFVGEASVRAVRCARVDRDRNPTGETFELAADLVLLAVGQSKLGDLVLGLPQVSIERGRIVTSASGATGHPRIFAGGDCANGGKEVVNAVAEGRDAAVAIHNLLAGAA